MDEETIDTGGTSGTEVLDSVSDSSGDPPAVEVISVDELLERLTSTGEEGEEAVPAEETEAEPAEPALSDQYFASMLEDTTNQEILTVCRLIRKDIEDSVHPAMTTQFSDYTVSEALLLLVLVGGVMSACWKMLKGAFSWLS